MRGKKKGDRSLRFPDSGTSMPGHGTGPLDAARRMLPGEYSSSDEEEMGRTRFGLVGGKQGLRGGERGGGAWCVVLERWPVDKGHHAKSGKAGGAGCRAEQTKVASFPVVVVVVEVGLIQ